jgi:hypothetical protein
MRQERPDEPVERDVRVDPLGRVPTRVFVGIAAAIVLVAVALIKPWGGSPAHVPLATDQVPLAAATNSNTTRPPIPSSAPAIVTADVVGLCIAPPTWRLITIEKNELGASRTLYSTQPTAASGPADATIPTTRVHARNLLGIGVCRPNPQGRPLADLPSDRVAIWEIPSGGQPVMISDPRIVDDALFSLGEAYYGPPPTAAAGAAVESRPWDPGRYVLEVSQRTAGAEPQWLGIDLVLPDVAVGPAGLE